MDFPTIAIQSIPEELIRLQPKGLMTIPKKFRETLGFKENSFVRVKKEPTRLIIEPVRVLSYPARSYTDEELKSFFELDRRESKNLQRKKLLK